MNRKKLLQRILSVLLVILLAASAWLIYQEYAERQRNLRLQAEMRDLYETEPSATPMPTSTPTPEPTQPQPSPATPTPEETEPEPQLRPQFVELLAINPDVIGWINIPGTIIDYPVVQTDNNRYYLDHDIYGEPLKAGTLFMDYRMALDGDDRHQIIYGHHLRDGTMFTDLMKYKQRAFFEEHRYIHLDQLYWEDTWEIFSIYVTSIDFYYIETRFADDQAWLDFIRTVQNKSKFKTDIVLTAQDQVLTLSTCTYEFDNARFVVHARRVREDETDAGSYR